MELPAGITPSGKRERMFFGTKQDACNFSEQQRIRLKNHGTVGMSSLNVGQLAQAATAFETLNPYQARLNEVINEWITRKQASGEDFDRAGHGWFGPDNIADAIRPRCKRVRDQDGVGAESRT